MIQELEKQMSVCQACDLHKCRKTVVFGEGSTSPKVMLVGEAPGEDEDTSGKPFVGLAGQKLTKILAFVELTRESTYITNAVLCRPPNNRVPRQEELEACRWRLDLQIQLLKPKVIVVLGKTALQQLNGSAVKGNLNSHFGDWKTYKSGEHEAKVMVTYHPSYHLRSPEHAYKVSLPHWTRLKTWLQNEKMETAN
jgi:DNA polymerase